MHKPNWKVPKTGEVEQLSVLPGGSRKKEFFVPRLIINTMNERKNQIIMNIIRSIRESDATTTYKEFLTVSPEGLRRISIVYELILKGLRGNFQPIVDDQFRTGYIRATQGVRLEDTLRFHRIYERTIIDEFLTMYLDFDMDYRDLQEEVKILGLVIDKARETVSKSYLKTREEIIEKRTEQIEGLYKLRLALSDKMTIRGLTELFVKDVSKILGSSSTVLTMYRPGQDKKTHLRLGSPKPALNTFRTDGIEEILETMRDVRTPHLIDRVSKKPYPVKPEGIATLPIGYWLAIPIFTKQYFYGFLSIDTLNLNNRFIGADAYVVLSVVSKIAEAMERERMFRTLQKNQQELRRLTSRIINVQEEERKKISAEIHDIIIQRLTVLWYKLLSLEDGDAGSSLGQSRDLAFLKTHINESILEARKIVYGLRPLMLEQLGLERTIREHAKGFQQETSIEVNLSIEGDCGILSAAKQTCVFRILQESLENVRKHSDTPSVRIKIAGKKKACSFRVEDFGSARSVRGSAKQDALKRHFGLMIISERAKSMRGTLKHHYKREGGFVVQGSIPCN